MQSFKSIIILVAALSLLLMISAGADPIGLTGLNINEPSLVVPDIPEQAKPLPAVKGPQRQGIGSQGLFVADDWELFAEDSLQAFIPAGGNVAVRFDPQTEQLSFVDPTLELSTLQWQAIQRAPEWLRADLYDNFRRFTYSFIADMVAQIVVDAQDPYVDEIAFEAAHISPDYLGGFLYLSMLTENVQWVYAADSLLNYVQIVDYGTSSSDDFWSTLKYWVVEADSDTVQVEIPRDIYYWYVVHPKLSDEIPTYINPANGQAADPPTGVFWRTYFLTHADSGYAFLPDYMADCNFLWAHTTAANPSNGAVGVLNGWINNVMHWGAGTERPIQPVRIYALHCGNCGEYSDITAAAGRTCLIPTVCTTAFCEDHTWNEFWEGEWIHWEPVNGMINVPLAYENGWGKVFSAVFNWRGDGYVWDVIDRYSEDVCTLNVTILDSAGKPADGQRISIKKNAPWGMYYDTWGVTNSHGQVSFTLGDANTFYLRVDGPLGGYPTGTGVVLAVSNSVPGQTYEWSHSMAQSTPALQISEQEPYTNPLDDYNLEIDFQSQYETAYAYYLSNNEFAAKVDSGFVNFFLVNQDNYTLYDSLSPAEGFNILNDVSSGSVNFDIPTAEPWYGVLSTRGLAKNQPYVKVMARVYRDDSGIEEPVAQFPLRFAIHPPYPNPFNPTTTIRYELPAAGLVKLSVYDISGKKVAELMNGMREAGSHEVTFDASGLAAGVYVYHLQAGEYTGVQKMVLLK
ncbi:MAG: T9SS type A sorting domain-containing protein [bacterium]|nr:T9SS type A sorting domain-containing protein [bacterium]